MVRYDSLRVLLAIIAMKNLEVMQFDVQTAFLYGKLEETIFMEVPEGQGERRSQERRMQAREVSLWAKTGSKMLEPDSQNF